MSAAGGGRSASGAAACSFQGNEGSGAITVRFLGGNLVPGLPRQAKIEVGGPVSADELVARLAASLGVTDLKAKLEHHFAVLVDGTSIQHLAGWSTLVRPGSDVTVVAPMGGGGPRV